MITAGFTESSHTQRTALHIPSVLGRWARIEPIKREYNCVMENILQSSEGIIGSNSWSKHQFYSPIHKWEGNMSDLSVRGINLICMEK